ncbi:glycosyltransferase family 2 protein [Bacillus alkalicellulosilyticus]|uniref:glycosyltransferase family 2 protein n=1 Tax=Alkalihalobacterium alkalicellulosilyticum TaxID=1912214 RepID=UPI0009978EA1|nr:glycosyltransferase family 2 protein [Bacillus alkalicellulosilyticus]
MGEVANNDLVSIITPTFNSARFIQETIESVINQTYPYWELIIVDDGSTDDTINLIARYQEKDSRIKLTIFQENKGPAVARNVAIGQANGKYIAFLDSDDVWLSKKLEKQLAFMQEQNIAFSFTQYMNMTEDGKETGFIEKVPKKVTYKDLLKSNVIGCLTVMLDREKVGEIQMSNIRTRQDYVLWLALCKRGIDAYGLQETLSKYRLVQHSISSNKIKMAKQNWSVYRDIEKLGLVQSSWYFIHYMFYKLRKYRV